MTTEKILVPNELCPIQLMPYIISPKYVDEYINTNIVNLFRDLEGKEKFNFVVLILNKFPTRRNLELVFTEIRTICKKPKKNYKDILYDKFVDALINNTNYSIQLTDYVKYYVRIYNKKAKQKLLQFIKNLPLTDLSNKDCNKLIKRSNDTELNEILWKRIVNNNPTWADLNYIYTHIEDYKEKAGELLENLYPESFLKAYNYEEYENLHIKRMMGEERFTKFSELRIMTKKEFFEIVKDYDYVSYEKNVHPKYVVIKFVKYEKTETPSLLDVYITGGKGKITLKLEVKMLNEEFYM